MTAIDVELQHRLGHWSDILQHLQFMHDTVVETKAQTVVELGARSGYSTVALLAGVEKTGGKLYSVDIDIPQWPETVWSHPLISFIQGDDLMVREQVPHDIDVLFIDTSHAHDQTLSELRLYGESSDIILMHDTDLDHPWGVPPEPAYPVREALKAWSAETGRSYYEREGSYGMGVVGL